MQNLLYRKTTILIFIVVLLIPNSSFCRQKALIYNRDGKFIYRSPKSRDGSIIIIDDRQTTNSLARQAEASQANGDDLQAGNFISRLATSSNRQSSASDESSTSRNQHHHKQHQSHHLRPVTAIPIHLIRLDQLPRTIPTTPVTTASQSTASANYGPNIVLALDTSTNHGSPIVPFGQSTLLLHASQRMPNQFSSQVSSAYDTTMRGLLPETRSSSTANLNYGPHMHNNPIVDLYDDQRLLDSNLDLVTTSAINNKHHYQHQQHYHLPSSSPVDEQYLTTNIWPVANEHDQSHNQQQIFIDHEERAQNQALFKYKSPVFDANDQSDIHNYDVDRLAGKKRRSSMGGKLTGIRAAQSNFKNEDGHRGSAAERFSSRKSTNPYKTSSSAIFDPVSHDMNKNIDQMNTNEHWHEQKLGHFGVPVVKRLGLTDY